MRESSDERKFEKNLSTRGFNMNLRSSEMHEVLSGRSVDSAAMKVILF